MLQVGEAVLLSRLGHFMVLTFHHTLPSPLIPLGSGISVSFLFFLLYLASHFYRLLLVLPLLPTLKYWYSRGGFSALVLFSLPIALIYSHGFLHAYSLCADDSQIYLQNIFLFWDRSSCLPSTSWCPINTTNSKVYKTELVLHFFPTLTPFSPLN